MKNEYYNDSDKKNSFFKLNHSDNQEELKTLNKRLSKNDMSVYFLSSKLLNLCSLNNAHKTILTKSTIDKLKDHSSLSNICDIKKTIDDHVFLKPKKVITLKNIEINKKLLQSQDKKHTLLDTNKILKLPRIAMKNIQIIPQPQGQTITMKNLKLYGEIRSLHKRLTDSYSYK